MTLQNFLEGVQILQKYYSDEQYVLGAEHDRIYLYKTTKPVETEDVRILICLGWFQEDAEYEVEFKVENYNSEESWTIYV